MRVCACLGLRAVHFGEPPLPAAPEIGLLVHLMCASTRRLPRSPSGSSGSRSSSSTDRAALPNPTDAASRIKGASPVDLFRLKMTRTAQPVLFANRVHRRECPPDRLVPVRVDLLREMRDERINDEQGRAELPDGLLELRHVVGDRDSVFVALTGGDRQEVTTASSRGRTVAPGSSSSSALALEVYARKMERQPETGARMDAPIRALIGHTNGHKWRRRRCGVCRRRKPKMSLGREILKWAVRGSNTRPPACKGRGASRHEPTATVKPAPLRP